MNQEDKDNLTVESNGRRMTLNPRFLSQQDAWDNLEEIKRTFALKFHIMDIMDDVEDEASMRVLDRSLQDLEFRIQELFNFEPNRNFHRFWERPHCKCPSMDNQDIAWGTNRAIVNQECPLHGKIEEIRKEEKRLFDTYFRAEFISQDTSRDSNETDV